MVIITELGFEIDLINNYEYKSFEKTHILNIPLRWSQLSGDERATVPVSQSQQLYAAKDSLHE